MEYSHATILDKRADCLQGRGYNLTSQFGEDGFIEAALKIIGVENRWCFEVGAGDGKTLSNTWRLRADGWRSVLIESDPAKFDLCRGYADLQTTVWMEHIGPESLDRILRDSGAPTDLDFGSLDIDGQDYYAWQGMREYRPRLMLVEFSPYGQNAADFLPSLNGEGQAGLNWIVQLGREKGYIPLLHTYVNVLFCREDQWKSS